MHRWNLWRSPCNTLLVNMKRTSGKRKTRSMQTKGHSMSLLEIHFNDVLHPASHSILSLTNPEAFQHRWSHPSLAKPALVSQVLRCFTVSPPAISNLFGGSLACVCVFGCFGFFVLGGLFACFWIPHGEITPVCEVVCEVERPSELSWRARHGRKKTPVC